MKHQTSYQVLALAITSALALPVQAQVAAKTEAATTERIEVTGSRIKRTDLAGASPVTVISAEDIALSGFANVEEILQAGIGNAGRSVEGNESSWTQGANTINLRGMGENRTLVLVNGKRVPQFPTATGGTTNFVDTSTFPSSAVERIEILTGGASAIYGSDAVGGVVNIILKKDYQGTRLNLRHENPQHGGRDKSKLALTTGFDSKFGQTVLVVDYSKDQMLRGGDRDLTSGLGPDSTDTYSTTTAYIRDRSKVFHKDEYVMANQQQCQQLFGDYGVWLENESRYKCRYNTNRDEGMQTAKDDWNLILNQHGELNDQWAFNALLQYGDKTTDRGNAQKSISPTIFMDRNNPGRYSYNAADFASSREFRVYRRLDDYGQQRDYTGKQKNLTSSLGVTGQLGDYELELSWAYGKSDYTRQGRNQMKADQLLKLISFNPADAANPAKWYPMNPLTAAQRDQLYGETLTDAGSGLNQYSAVLTGDWFDLPAGPVQFAASAEWAKEWYFDLKDADTLSGNLLGQGGTQGEGGRKRYAAAGELALPIFGADAATGQLDASLALRYDRYDDKSDVGGATTPQLGLTWRPHSDILLRLSAGRSFRAPDLHRMYAGLSRAFAETTLKLDPNFPVGLSDSYESISAGNIALTEEKGRFVNLGLVANLTDDTSLSLDVWRISLDGAVYSESASRILANPSYNQSAGYKSCNDLPGIGYIMQQPSGQTYQDLLCVRRGTINSAYEASQGIDAELSFQQDLADFGKLKLTPKASYLLKKEYQAYAGGERVEETRDNYLPAWKAEMSARWSLQDISVNLSWYYLGSAEGWNNWVQKDAAGKDVQTQVWSKLAAFQRINLNASYDFDSYGEVTLGINNLADQMPPLYPVGHPNRNVYPYFEEDAGYNTVGRVFYLGYEYKL
ncbi:MAG: TonB-dependent receptor [Rheinheimera sp.]|nr:TonB-dependent receptor [Rheinheimera sp.]